MNEDQRTADMAGRHGKKSGRLRRHWEKVMRRTPQRDQAQWTAGLGRLQALPWRRIDVSFRGSSWSMFAHTHIQVQAPEKHKHSVSHPPPPPPRAPFRP